MELERAKTLAEDLMIKHKVDLYHGWTFKFDNSKSRFGQCDCRKKIISLSKYLVELNSDEEVRDTILHEIAHALCPGAHHSRRWKVMANFIGARPKRCYGVEVVTPKPKYVGICLSCNTKFKRNRLSWSRQTFAFHVQCQQKCGAGAIGWMKQGPSVG